LPVLKEWLIFAENEVESPWEPFAEEHGFSPEESTVTLDECIWYNRLGPLGCMNPMLMEADMARLVSMVKDFIGGMIPARNAREDPIWGSMDAEVAINGHYCTLVLYPALAWHVSSSMQATASNHLPNGCVISTVSHGMIIPTHNRKAFLRPLKQAASQG
jgi:hypothetical protein